MKDKNISEIEFREDLDYDFLRHRTLGVLIRKRIDVELYHKEKDIVLGVNHDELLKQLGVTKEELFIVTSKLREETEIEFYNDAFKGYFAKPKAIDAYISKKYLKRPRNEKRENVKYYFQIIVPIISLIVAAMSIGLNIYQASL